jgi:hypothetical protein
MIIHPHTEQYSEAWFNVRRGRPTSSQFKRIITSVKAEYSKGAQGYMIDLVAECFVPTYAAFTGNAWTERGNELEPEAREAFSTLTGKAVEQVGFVTQGEGGPWRDFVGCSPDGLIKGPDGEWMEGLEIKCPSPSVHVGYVLDGVLPDDYKQQVHGSLAITGLPRWNFFSYYPGMQPLHVVVEPDDYTEKLSRCIDRFILEYRDAREKMIPKLILPTT